MAVLRARDRTEEFGDAVRLACERAALTEARIHSSAPFSRAGRRQPSVKLSVLAGVPAPRRAGGPLPLAARGPSAPHRPVGCAHAWPPLRPGGSALSAPRGAGAGAGSTLHPLSLPGAGAGRGIGPAALAERRKRRPGPAPQTLGWLTAAPPFPRPAPLPQPQRRAVSAQLLLRPVRRAPPDPFARAAAAIRQGIAEVQRTSADRRMDFLDPARMSEADRDGLEQEARNFPPGYAPNGHSQRTTPTDTQRTTRNAAPEKQQNNAGGPASESVLGAD